ncbi:MAG: V-type ATP synthase subunit D [Proteobacteria bacterium]|nr:V-type ATP synthase subunit D [Pseudomonadota bacterium]
MAIKFQYNKTYLQQLNKELTVREKALPTLQAKESALRNEVRMIKQVVREMAEEIEEKMEALTETNRFWCEFPPLLSIAEVKVGIKSIAGVKTPYLEELVFEEKPFSLHSSPNWFLSGLVILKAIVELRIKSKLARKKLELLEYARKKTTQKVNLYEKVQIPEYNEAILKIKRYLEDYENLAKSSQKILKAKLEREAAA